MYICFLFLVFYFFIDCYICNVSSFFAIYLDDKNITVDNITFDMNRVWEAVSFLGGVAVFKSGIQASSSVLAKSALPSSVKMAFILSGGAASYFTFETSRRIWRASEASKVKPVSVDVTIKQNSDGKFEAQSPLEDNEYFSNLIDILDSSFNLYICIFILINLTIIFIIFKSLSDLNYNLDWLSKYKYGKWFQLKIIKILHYWRTSNLVFFYLGLFLIWLFSGINIFFIKYVLIGLKSL